MKYNQLQNIISIPKDEKKVFKNLVREQRKKLIDSPSETVDSVIQDNKQLLDSVYAEGNVSDVIIHLREETYKRFLIQESSFNVAIMHEIGNKLSTPRVIIDTIIEHRLDLSTQDNVIDQIRHISSDYAGRISPYIYELCLSNTQSRRSRAGKTFEAIIYKLYDSFLDCNNNLHTWSRNESQLPIG